MKQKIIPLVVQVFCVVHLSATTTRALETATNRNGLQPTRNDFTESSEDVDISNLGLKVLDKTMFYKYHVLDKLNLSSNELTSTQSLSSAVANVRFFILDLSHNNLGFPTSDDQAYNFSPSTQQWKYRKVLSFGDRYFWSVDLSHNSFTAMLIDFHVTKLNLSNNNISCPSEIKSGQTQPLYVGELNLSHNLIDCQSEFFTRHINTLDMSYNQLVSVDTRGLLSGLTQLIELNLSHNKIRYVAPQAFEDTVRLKHLNLKSNQIRNIYKQAWAPLPVIWYIDLSSNRLEYLEWDTDFMNKPANKIIVNVENNSNSRWSSDSINFRFCNGSIYSVGQRILGCIAFYNDTPKEYLLPLNEL